MWYFLSSIYILHVHTVSPLCRSLCECGHNLKCCVVNKETTARGERSSSGLKINIDNKKIHLQSKGPGSCSALSKCVLGTNVWSFGFWERKKRKRNYFFYVFNFGSRWKSDCSEVGFSALRSMCECAPADCQRFLAGSQWNVLAGVSN